MKKQFTMSFLFCAVTALCFGGCAKQELVKQDQMIPPVAASPRTPQTAPASSPAAAVLKPENKDAGSAHIPFAESPATLQTKRDAAAQAAKDATLSASLEKVFFDFDSYTLSPQAREALAKNAEILKQKKYAKVHIEGHCDELGSDDYNLALGEKRAQAAFNYLLTMGVPSGRLSAISYGKEKPADPGHDEAARAKNRRDELVVTSK